MVHEILIAGFGGQGVMSMGQLLAYAGMLEQRNVSWLPSYGPEQRGGTANVSIVVSDQPVGSPLITRPKAAIVLNKPSYDKFEPLVLPGGVLIVNTSLIDMAGITRRNDITYIEVPATELANEMGEPKVANSIILGAYLEYSHVVSPESVVESLKKVLSDRVQHLIPLNKQALDKGASLVSAKKEAI